MKLQEIKEIIEKFTGENITIKSNRRDLADIRSIFIYCAFKYADQYVSYHKLGLLLNRDHSTVIATKKRFFNLYDVDKDFTKQAKAIINLVKTSKQVEPDYDVEIETMDFLDLRREYLKQCERKRHYENKYHRILEKYNKLIGLELQKVS